MSDNRLKVYFCDILTYVQVVSNELTGMCNSINSTLYMYIYMQVSLIICLPFPFCLF